jgi:nitroimidazol reductase NimA-like FMN-containing flavoprotein (pyridoxamine 5'-phosphate oxidase superfamily)
MARRLLSASTLCAIATVSPGSRSHVNTAYFAWSRALDVVWLSAPEALHSRNVRTNPSVAVAVYDSTLSWGGPDRGIQLFGSASELAGRAALEAEHSTRNASLRPHGWNSALTTSIAAAHVG